MVESTEDNVVTIYDEFGCLLATKRDEGLLRDDVPVTRMCLIRIGDAPARRVVVVR